jgi:phenylacetate-CoA ligase
LREQKLPRRDLDDLIDKRIRAITRLAYDHNPFLHSLFESVGMNPHSDIWGRSDLLKAYKKGVRTTGADVVKCYADYAPQQGTIELWSSGSTGIPKKVLMSKSALERLQRGNARTLISGGVRDGDKMLSFSAPPPYASGSTSALGVFNDQLRIQRLVFRSPNIPERISESEKARIVQSFIDMMYEFNPDHVSGGTFVLKEFAQLMTSFGFDKGRLSLKSVRFGGDPVTDEDRITIRNLWNAEPFDSYASTEAGFIAYECPSHSGMHVNEPDLFLTSIDSESGEEVGTEKTAKDLFTNLYEDGEFPATFFINYSHKDNIAILRDPCPCGDVFKLSTHPTRDAKKRPIPGFGFDIKERRSVVRRAARKIRKSLS